MSFDSDISVAGFFQMCMVVVDAILYLPDFCCTKKKGKGRGVSLLGRKFLIGIADQKLLKLGYEYFVEKIKFFFFRIIINSNHQLEIYNN